MHIRTWTTQTHRHRQTDIDAHKMHEYTLNPFMATFSKFNAYGSMHTGLKHKTKC